MGLLSGVDIPDAVSGFRAFSRNAALRINILSSFSYTTEMLIQAGRKKLSVCSVPIRVNPKTRESRLFRTVPGFIARSAGTMVRTYALYQPFRLYTYGGLLILLLGAAPIVRFLYDGYLLDSGIGK